MWFLFQTVFSEYPLIWEEQGAGHVGTSRQGLGLPLPGVGKLQSQAPSLPAALGRLDGQTGLAPLLGLRV